MLKAVRINSSESIKLFAKHCPSSGCKEFL